MKNVVPWLLAAFGLTIIACGGGGDTGGGTTTTTTTSGTTGGAKSAHLTADNATVNSTISDATPVIEVDSTKMRISWYHTNSYPNPFLTMNIMAPFPANTPIGFTTPGGRAYAATQGDVGFFATQSGSGSLTFTKRGSTDSGTLSLVLYDIDGNPLHLTGTFANVPEEAFGTHGISG